MKLAVPFVLVLIASCRATPEYIVPRGNSAEATYQAIVNDGRYGRVADEDRALWSCELGTAAMMVGREREAWEAFHQASRTMGTLESTSREARRAILGEESTKRWKGDPHERSMGSYYKGLLYWRRGDLDNASACFKSGLLADAYSEIGEYQVDFAALSFLLGWVSSVRGNEEQARYSFREAAENAPANLLYDDPNPAEHNVLAVVELGQGPRKVRTGPWGSAARYDEVPSSAKAMEIVVDGVSHGVSAEATNLHHQAMTRGKNAIDSIRRGKAVFKTVATTAGIVLINKGARKNSPGLMLAGAGALLAGQLTRARADVRYWTLLPAEIQFLPLRLAPGVHEVTVLALDERHVAIPGWKKTFTVSVQGGRGQLWWFRAQPGLRMYGLTDRPIEEEENTQ